MENLVFRFFFPCLVFFKVFVKFVGSLHILFSGFRWFVVVVGCPYESSRRRRQNIARSLFSFLFVVEVCFFFWYYYITFVMH